MEESGKQPEKQQIDVVAPSTPIRKNRKGRVVALILVVIILCGASGIGGAALVRYTNVFGSGQVNLTNSSDGNLKLSQSEQTISAIVAKVSPAIVSIITTSAATQNGYVSQAAGTGMIVSPDGYVVTNKHVINGANKVTIITSDGKTYKDVNVLGSDPLNDVAFLKINNVKDLPVVIIGDSKTVQSGQSVVAIGNALGQYQNTVTSGIISGLGRPVVASTSEDDASSESLSDLLQTDAAINSGNSGGPLLNMSGQVIGMNTAVASDAQSIGFAIPIGAVKGMLKHLVATGKLERAVLGLQYISITPEVKEEFNLSVDKGDYVSATSGSAIRANSPAAKAGINEKDIITKVNDQEIGPGKSVSTLLGEYEPGDQVTLTILRGGSTLTKTMTLEAY